MPYIFNSANESSTLGLPMMRAMLLEFQDDPAVENLDRQYMFGESLLVAPILNEEGDASFYLPKGKWTHLLTNDLVEGGTWLHENHDYLSLPLFARPNSIIAMGSDEYHADYDYAQNVELHLFQLEDGKSISVTVRNPKSEVELAVTAARFGKELVVNVTETTGKPWSLLVRGIFEISKSDNVKVVTTELGMKLIPEQDAQSFTVGL